MCVCVLCAEAISNSRRLGPFGSEIWRIVQIIPEIPGGQGRSKRLGAAQNSIRDVGCKEYLELLLHTIGGKERNIS